MRKYYDDNDKPILVCKMCVDTLNAEHTREGIRMLNNRNLFIAFCVLTVLDYLSTLMVLSKGGQELNKLAAMAFHSSNSVLYGLVFKVLTIIFVAIIWRIMKSLNKEASFNKIIKLVNVGLSLVLLNNFYWGLFYMN